MDNIFPEVFSEFLDFQSDNEIEEALDSPTFADEIQHPSSELRSDFPGFEGREVVVYGNPVETGSQLDFVQGDNPYLARGNCGLVSVSNMLNLSGITAANETMITKYAIDHDLCVHGWFMKPEDRGGVRTEFMSEILGGFGIETNSYSPKKFYGTPEGIAQQVESGHVAAMGLNAGFMWDDPTYLGDGHANHEVTVTGTVRDAQTGKLLGLTVCDSGNNKACDVLTMDRLNACYTTRPGADVIFSVRPIRT